MTRIRIEGLDDLRGDLVGMRRRLERATKLAGIRAVDLVEHTARPRVPSGPPAGGHVSSTLRSLPNAVAVSIGDRRFPYIGWLDFGGTINKHTRHPTVRPYAKRGRYIWAALGDRHDQVLDIYQDELMRAAREAGLGNGR